MKTPQFSWNRRTTAKLGGIVCLVWTLLLPGAGSAASSIGRHQAAIAALAAGHTNVAVATWWGYDPDDATEAVQAAIDSGAPRVIVPRQAAAWTLRPIALRSGLELIFEPGVLVLAKAGEFRGGGDSLFRATDCTNVVIRGPGATLRMRKSDYQKPPYVKAEWRMGLALVGCRDVLVEGLRIESTGGDGIYVGSSRAHRWCENVTIRDCVCHDNHRQGISVISAIGLRIENCTLSATDGTPPAAGIDFEPDEPDECLIDCVVRNCLVVDNAGNGILVWLKPLNGSSRPVSLRFEDCVVRMGGPGTAPADVGDLGDRGWSGIAIGEIGDAGPGGTIDFVRCRTANTGREAVRLVNKSAAGARVQFSECRWRNTWLGRHRAYTGPRAPILLRGTSHERCRESGGVAFDACRIEDDLDGPAVRFEDDEEKSLVRDVVGRITVRGPQVPRARWGPGARDVHLQLEAEPAR